METTVNLNLLISYNLWVVIYIAYELKGIINLQQVEPELRTSIKGIKMHILLENWQSSK